MSYNIIISLKLECLVNYTMYSFSLTSFIFAPLPLKLSFLVTISIRLLMQISLLISSYTNVDW